MDSNPLDGLIAEAERLEPSFNEHGWPETFRAMLVHLKRLQQVEQDAYRLVEWATPQILAARLKQAKHFGKVTPEREEGIEAHLIKQLDELGFVVNRLPAEVPHGK